VREITFVPETTPVDELWNTLNREQHYLAIVFDEYGGTMGMVTREDLVEEIFGEVEDEFDPDSIPLIRAVGERVFLIRGDAAVSLVNSRFNLKLPEGMAYTIGGLLPNVMGRFPEAGEEIEVAGTRLLAHTVKERVVERVQLTLPPKRQPVVEEKV
jgi:CBS domain containing-hemolysin-like protein